MSPESAVGGDTSPVALTGATGFLGSHIWRALRGSGRRVRAVVRSPEKAVPINRWNDEVRRADLSDAPALTVALRGASAVVANAALGSWQGDLDRFFAVNVEGVRHLLGAMHSAGVRRLVFISTVAVCRTRPWVWQGDDSPRYGADGKRGRWQLSDLTTDWRYAVTKSVGEDLATELAGRYDIQLTVLRPGPVFGVGDPKLTQRYLKMWRSRLCWAPTVGVPQVCATDVAAAVVAALARPLSVGATYTLAGPPTSPFEVVSTMRQLAARGPVVVPVPVPVWVAWDTRRAQAELDFSSRPLSEALADVLRAEGVELLAQAPTLES